MSCVSVDLLNWTLCFIGPAADAVLAAGAVHKAVPGPDLGRIRLDKIFLRNDIDS